MLEPTFRACFWGSPAQERLSKEAVCRKCPCYTSANPMGKSIKTGTPGAFRHSARLAWQLWGSVGHLEVCIWLLGTRSAHVQDLEPAFRPSGPGRLHWANIIGNVLLLMQRPRGSGNAPLYLASEGSLRTGLPQFLYHVWATEDPFGCVKSWTRPGACSPRNFKCLGDIWHPWP